MATKNMMQRGGRLVARALNANASRTVRYESGNLIIDVVATVGATPTETTDPDGVVTRSTVRDYLIDADQFARFAYGFEPKRGDIIIDARRTYEVQPVGDDPAARWSDRDHTRWRIHTRHIAEPAV